ncbi:C-type lectin domain family 4 member A isoform X3 [Scophthalmus maximus]|uniref:C-type lectin domain family 4 member A isoform X3 n=1 Tax=Scophthalmus maximus TaxID=52904 RepID=UPI0015E15BBA|nr:C-type lectin domain family 4 member A isoform X3 [Scophthalmus maximus]
MEEELNYATVVFKNGGRPSEEKNEDSTIYSTVKSRVPVTTVPADGEAPANFQHFRLLVVCLGILCVLLVASISAIVYICVVMNEQRAFAANLSHLKKENEQLVMERSILENRTEELTRVRDDLNWTLEVIMKFDSFPVTDFCPDKKCQPCQKGWILFQENCYLFYESVYYWRTWQDSQKFCQSKAANLVVIDSSQEQEFITNHSKFYYDMFHGYWFGLHQNAEEDWIWVDGRNDTVWYWMKEEFADSGQCAMIIPFVNPTANWDTVNCLMRNKFICESGVLIRTPVT